jgi:peptide-methionine (S)-S-oxide reductase
MAQLETVAFGGGCFWCTEAVFKMIKGVTSVLPGYAGGAKETATYYRVAEGNTGHVEVVEVQYDPAQVAFGDLLTVFFGSHDPTTRNRQGADVGTQYRSVIFTTTDAQRDEAHVFIKELNASSEFGSPIVTTVEPLTAFYVAEEYHHNFYDIRKGTGDRFCELVINPRLEKVKVRYANLLKDLYTQNPASR